MQRLNSFPQRALLHDEVHQRPSIPVQTPSRVSSLTLYGATADQYRDFFNQLLMRVGQPAIPASTSHWQQTLPDFELRWSIHTEFARFTVVQTQTSNDFEPTALAALPDSVWGLLPGQVMCATHALVITPEQAPEQLQQVSQRWFKGQKLIGAKVAHQKMVLLTDFKRHDDPLIESGAARLLVVNLGAGKHTTGRILLDFFEMESYRLMGLLSFPVAKQLLPQVTDLENQLQAITKAIAEGEEPELTQTRLNQVAEALEEAIGSSHFRFSATRAYAAMMNRRLIDLNETAFEGFASFTHFMERRISPAFATVESVSNRLQELSTHLQRTSELLRTRIEMNLLKQNQHLLTALNQRAALQLRLQQTVEGLSVGVLGYYAISLLHYLLEGAAHAGVNIDVPIATAAAVPVVLGLLMWRLRALRKHFRDELSTH